MKIRRSALVGLVPAAGLLVMAGQASASGFQLLEQNASGIGNAFAGSAAIADNASTIHFNPAGMTRLQPREFSVGLSLVRPSFKFRDGGSQSGVLSGGTGDAGGWAALPNAYLSWALNRNIVLGIGLGAPFGLSTDYDDGWVGAAQSIEFDIKTYNINPSVAWRVNDRLSLGFGLNWQRMDAEYERAVSIAAVPLAATHAILDADSDAWGWNVGLLYALSDATRIGASYRSRIEHELKGDLDIRGPAAGANPALAAGRARADVELPETVIISAVHQLDTRWELLGDLSWTGWSSVDAVDIMRTSGPLTGLTVQTLDADFKDTWRLAIGANYHVDDSWTLKFGIAYDQSPVRDRHRRLVALPDDDRTWLSLGAQWRPSRDARLDVGLAYLYVPDTKIDNDQLSADPARNRGRVTGEYRSKVWLLGVQYSMAF
ncbi:MAG: transporter [Limnobacter sp.]|nr:transporter [Limnobacter sp.]